jgi:N-acetyl sugar amidotransferase
MKYCDICILPDSRPGIEFDATTKQCNCSFVRKDKRKIPESRIQEFEILVKKTKAKNKDWDCVIPVSGGKDSTWQTIKALESGLKPLCVTWRTPGRTSIGQQNLDNLISLGVDHMDVSINPITEKELTKQAFIRLGIPALPMHMALFSIPTRFALKLDIPLIIWGENSAYEYGGEDEDADSMKLTHKWLEKYGVNGGTAISEWVSESLSMNDLHLYSYPSESEIAEAGLSPVFLGYFFDWSPREAFELASKHGFKAAEHAVVGTYNFADIDEAFIMSVHHWLKWYKFGITREWDNLSIDIRLGKITRAEAIDIIREKGEHNPIKEIEMFCDYIDMSTQEFYSIAEKFRNNKIWITDSKKGTKKIKSFLIQDFEWSQI